MSGRWHSDSGASDLSEEKHEIVASRSRRDRTCFLSPFFASLRVQDIPGSSPSPPPSSPSPLPPPPSSSAAIKSDLTSIYLRTYPVSAAAAASPERGPFSPLFFFSRHPRSPSQGTLRMNFVYKLPITFFSSTSFRLIRRRWE